MNPLLKSVWSVTPSGARKLIIRQRVRKVVRAAGLPVAGLALAAVGAYVALRVQQARVEGRRNERLARAEMVEADLIIESGADLFATPLPGAY